MDSEDSVVNSKVGRILTMGLGGEVLRSAFPEKKKLTPPSPVKDNAAAEEAAKAEAERLRKRRGVIANWMTGGLGVTGPAPTVKTKLGE